MSLACSSFQGNHWDLARYLRLVLGEKGVQLCDPAPQLLPGLAFHDGSGGLEGLGTNLDGDLRMGHEVAVPIRMRRCSRVRGDDEQAIAVRYVHHRCRAVLTAPGTRSSEQE